MEAVYALVLLADFVRHFGFAHFGGIFVGKERFEGFCRRRVEAVRS